MCERDKVAASSLTGSTPKRRRRSTPAAAPGSPCAGGRRRTSAEEKEAELEPISTAAASPRQKGLNATHLDLHALGLNDVNLVLVAAPNLIVDDRHATDGVMRPTEVH